jgi:hypothetical protein
MKINSGVQAKTVLQVCTYDIEQAYLHMEEEKRDTPARDLGWKTEKLKRDWWDNLRWDWLVLLKHLSASRVNKKMFPLEITLESCSIDDALWVLGAVKGHRNAMRLFACYCAKKMLPIFEKRYPCEMLPLRKAIYTAESFARGQADEAELASARQSIRVLIGFDEDGCVLYRSRTKFKAIFRKKHNLSLEYYARLAALATVRDCIEGGIWRAALYTAEAIAHFTFDVLAENTASSNIALSKSADAVAEIAANSIENIAKDMFKAVSGDISSIQYMDNTEKNSTRQAVREAICNDVDSAYRLIIENTMKAAVKKEITAEFLKLCRLEDEYGEVEEI